MCGLRQLRGVYGKQNNCLIISAITANFWKVRDLLSLCSLCEYFIWFVFYSFCGWLYETTICSVSKRRFVNRGFLCGPVCPIYGLGALLVLLFLGSLSDHVAALFFASMILTCALEYAVSCLLEKAFHARWWDYSKYRFQLHGRICLLGGVVFGALSVLIVEVIHPTVSAFTVNIPKPLLLLSSVVLFVLLICDTVTTVSHLCAHLPPLSQRSAVQKIKKRLLWSLSIK